MRLYSREAETQRIDSLLDSARAGRGGVLVLRGEPGAGRTALLVASELLAVEADAIADEDPESAAFMLLDAATAASMSGALRTSVELAREAWALAEPLGGYMADASRAALEEYDRAGLLLDRFHDDARKMSAPTFLVPVLCLRADLAFRTGNWIRAYADAAESLRLARETGQLAFHSLAFLARVEAARGLDTDCRAHAQEALELADRDGIGATTTYARWALGLLALGRGWIPEAIDHLERVAELVDEHGMRQPIEVPWAQDLVEAYARSGRRADAARVLDRLQSQAEASRLSSALAAASRCRGLLADEDGFCVEFDHALRSHERTPTPFERARTELCFGEMLRRARHRSDARVHLRAALDTFEHLDAAPWSARARAELAATGEVSNPSREQWTHVLTPQEIQLSMIVGRGATNKEASAALFISPKTVEAHLHRVYVKLGIRSRTELAGLVARVHTGE